jgi:hypothetical protein
VTQKASVSACAFFVLRLVSCRLVSIWGMIPICRKNSFLPPNGLVLPCHGFRLAVVRSKSVA